MSSWKLSVIISASAVIVMRCYQEFKSSQEDNGLSRLASTLLKLMRFLLNSCISYAYMHVLVIPRQFSHSSFSNDSMKIKGQCKLSVYNIPFHNYIIISIFILVSLKKELFYQFYFKNFFTFSS